MTKLCTYCGKEIPDTTKICPYCNRPLMEKVLTYRVDEKPSKDISSTSRRPTDFQTNIYSVSDDELDRIFEKKLPQKPINQQINTQRNNQRSKRYKKQKNENTAVIVLTGIIVVLIVVLAAVLLSGSFDKNQDSAKQTTTQITTTQITKTTTVSTTQETTTTTTQKATYSASSTDLYGYLGVSFANVSTHFGEQIKSSTIDEFYGGSVYYFDGLTITTVESGVIVSLTMDYSLSSKIDSYRFKELFYGSTYEEVLEQMGTPQSDQLNSASEPCVTYVLDIGSGQSIKFFFDNDKKLAKFDLFYAD